MYQTMPINQAITSYPHFLVKQRLVSDLTFEEVNESNVDSFIKVKTLLDFQKLNFLT